MELLLRLLPYIQIALAIVLTGAILVQQRGAGLSGAFGGNEGTIHYERRGSERTLFRGTFIIAIVFVLVSALPIFIAQTTPSKIPVPVTQESAEEAENVLQLTDDKGNPVDITVSGENVETNPVEEAPQNNLLIGE